MILLCVQWKGKRTYPKRNFSKSIQILVTFCYELNRFTCNPCQCGLRNKNNIGSWNFFRSWVYFLYRTTHVLGRKFNIKWFIESETKGVINPVQIYTVYKNKQPFTFWFTLFYHIQIHPLSSLPPRPQQLTCQNLLLKLSSYKNYQLSANFLFLKIDTLTK